MGRIHTGNDESVGGVGLGAVLSRCGDGTESETAYCGLRNSRRSGDDGASPRSEATGLSVTGVSFKRWVNSINRLGNGNGLGKRVSWDNAGAHE